MKLIRMMGLLIVLNVLAGFSGWHVMSYFLSQPEDSLPEDSVVVAAEPLCASCVFVTDAGFTNERSNPILTVQVYDADKSLVASYNSLSGRAYTQHLDRNISGNESPSPNGVYLISPETVGYHPETGGVFRPYEPTFTTQRSLLGFHVDPSWGLNNGEDGTLGCIAFKTISDYLAFNAQINELGITTLIIDRND